MYHQTCAYKVFYEYFFLEKYLDDNRMFCERSQKDPVGYVAGDDMIFLGRVIL